MATEKNFNNNNPHNDSVHSLSRVANHEQQPPSILDNLPTLDDVLHRQSQPPVCLYNYYIVLRDRLELETLLDFWLDVAQADILYKRYIRYANRRGSTAKFGQQKPSISSSIIDYNRLSYQPSSPISVHHRSSDILTHMLLLHPRASLATTMNSVTTAGSNKKPPPTQLEMAETIERIYLRYIVPSAEKELNGLPASIKESIANYFAPTPTVIIDDDTPPIKKKLNPDNPIIYAQAKSYVHQLLQSTFPLFLQYKVFMNLTLPQQIGRLACGLILLLTGFSLEFSLIFLDVHPWQKRLWGIIPIVSGVFFIVTSVTGIDPIWVLAFNLSETVPFNFNHIIQPQVKKILRKRSFVVMAIILFISLIFMIFFCAVSGKRL